MKKLLSFTTIFSFLILNLQTQIPASISGLIQDVNGQPISYVNVGIVGTSTGTVSKEDGSYSLFFKANTNQNDTVRFSIIGYESQSFLIKEMTDQQTIVLEEAVVELSEVVVRPSFSNQKIVGRSKTNGGRKVNFSIAKKPRQNLGAEIGKKFKVKNKATQIESLSFFIRSNNFSATKFRISFYSVKKNMPDQHLTNQDIIVSVDDKKTGWIEVDLSGYDIFTKKDFIATIQWIDSSEDGKTLAMPIRFPVFGKKHYYKFGSQAKWKRYKNMSISMTVGLAY